ncbi:2-amino-4-hydroxy-6-hydroxymethyldihydropteridine pyrophosphokinase [Candidatus Magnetoovum chiemensis]|nr:2-amino-4-hydroxy-6-hydroxymethyldihydropteridine pyrophosphokinase [Candidatus Magnetoovum chiemensis]
MKDGNRFVNIVYLGLGSNQGNRAQNCFTAIDLIKANDMIVCEVSSPYENKAWGVEKQPDFINLCVSIKTDRTPKELLCITQEIEKKVGRVKTYKWGPRVIDIDILLYNDLIIEDEELVIPHPYMLERDFVIAPLKEIAPDVIHPVIKKKIKDIPC